MVITSLGKTVGRYSMMEYNLVQFLESSFTVCRKSNNRENLEMSPMQEWVKKYGIFI